MRKIEWTITHSAAIVIMVFGTIFALSPLVITQTDTHDIPSSLGISISKHYENGARIEGYFTIRFGNEEIEFQIKDPSGVVIYDSGIVQSRHDFALTTEHAGVYSLLFENKQDKGKTLFLSESTTLIGTTHGFIMVSLGVALLVTSIAATYIKKKDVAD